MRQTSDAQLEQIWSAATERDICPNALRTIDQWGNEITIFTGWGDVEAMADLVYSILPGPFIADHAPSWPHAKYPIDPRHHIEWAIGDFGFEDQYQTCSHCNVAIVTDDPYPRYYYDEDLGDITCDSCLKANPSFAEDYLAYCARHLENGDRREIARPHFADPSEYGYIPLNPYTAYGEYAYGDFLIKYEGLENFPLEDHSEFPHWLNYADDKDLDRLGKSARLIDPNIQLVAQYNPRGYGAYLYWAKFEIEPEDIPPSVALAILQYAIGLVFTKYKALRNKENGIGARSSAYDVKGVS